MVVGNAGRACGGNNAFVPVDDHVAVGIIGIIGAAEVAIHKSFGNISPIAHGLQLIAGIVARAIGIAKHIQGSAVVSLTAQRLDVAVEVIAQVVFMIRRGPRPCSYFFIVGGGEQSVHRIIPEFIAALFDGAQSLIGAVAKGGNISIVLRIA